MRIQSAVRQKWVKTDGQIGIAVLNPLQGLLGLNIDCSRLFNYFLQLSTFGIPTWFPADKPCRIPSHQRLKEESTNKWTLQSSMWGSINHSGYIIQWWRYQADLAQCNKVAHNLLRHRFLNSNDSWQTRLICIQLKYPTKEFRLCNRTLIIFCLPSSH